jgi:hypothetical protein
LLYPSKSEIITQIKDIINNYGAFSTGDVAASSDPCINSNSSGDIVELIEGFYLSYVEVTTYDDQIELYTTNILYEDLDYDILLEILELANDWKQLNLENNE